MRNNPSETEDPIYRAAAHVCVERAGPASRVCIESERERERESERAHGEGGGRDRRAASKV